MLDHDWFLQHTTWWLSPVLRWFQTHELWGEGHQSIFRQFFTREIPEYSVGIFWDFEFCGEEYLMMGWVGQGICQHLPQCGLLRLYILGSHFWFLILIFDIWFLIFDFWILILIFGILPQFDLLRLYILGFSSDQLFILSTAMCALAFIVGPIFSSCQGPLTLWYKLCWACHSILNIQGGLLAYFSFVGF